MIYVIHFNSPRYHANHYVGTTIKLHRRLKTHASGRGAKLLAALADDDEHWQLAALYIPRTMTHRFRIERQVKNVKHTARYCPICRPKTHRAPRGTIEYDVKLLRFPTTSMTLDYEQQRNAVKKLEQFLMNYEGD